MHVAHSLWLMRGDTTAKSELTAAAKQIEVNLIHNRKDHYDLLRHLVLVVQGFAMHQLHQYSVIKCYWYAFFFAVLSNRLQSSENSTWGWLLICFCSKLLLVARILFVGMNIVQVDCNRSTVSLNPQSHKRTKQSSITPNKPDVCKWI